MFGFHRYLTTVVLFVVACSLAAGDADTPTPAPHSPRPYPVFIAGESIGFTGISGRKYELRDDSGKVVDTGDASDTFKPKITDPGWYLLSISGAESDSPGIATPLAVLRPNAVLPALPPSIDNNDLVQANLRAAIGAGPLLLDVHDVSNPDAVIVDLKARIAAEGSRAVDTARPRFIMVSFSGGCSNIEAVKTIVSALKGDVTYWMDRIDPDQNMIADYFVSSEMKPFYATVKSIDPKLMVIGPCIKVETVKQIAWLETFFKSGGNKTIDAIALDGIPGLSVGDAYHAQQALGFAQEIFTKYKADKMPRCFIGDIVSAADHGVFVPRRQARAQALQLMLGENFKVPKERTFLWMNKTRPNATNPRWFTQGSAAPTPAAIITRVFSEEVASTSYGGTYDLGPTGNKLALGEYFLGATKHVAVFMGLGGSAKVELKIGGNAPNLHTISAYGAASDLPVPKDGLLTLDVPDLPLYIEPAVGQSVHVLPIDWGPNLAFEKGVTVAATDSAPSADLTTTDETDIPTLHNMVDELVGDPYGKGDALPWTHKLPDTGTVILAKMPVPKLVQRVMVDASAPEGMFGAPTDYEVQIWDTAAWKTFDHITVPTQSINVAVPKAGASFVSFYSGDWLFATRATPIKTTAIRLLIHSASWGGAAGKDVRAAQSDWPEGSSGSPNATLREVSVYGPYNPGTGLLGTYYNGESFEHQRFTHLDPVIDIDFVSKRMDRIFGAGHPYSVRWKGYIMPKYSEAYTFTTKSDDGVRVVFNDKLVIDNWTTHGDTLDQFTVKLIAGQKYPIRIAYFENGIGGADLHLSWQSHSQPMQIIPKDCLYPPE